MNTYDIRTLLDNLAEARIYAGAEFERLCNNNQHIDACVFQSIRDSIAQNIQLLQSYMICKALEQQPSEDCISRQEVKEFVEYIQTLKDKHNDEDSPINYGTICDLVIRGWKLVESKGKGMSNLEKAKEKVKEYYSVADHGIFNSRNTVRDVMVTIYKGEGLTIDVCYDYSYFEVFGLSDAEFKELERYYESFGRK